MSTMLTILHPGDEGGDGADTPHLAARLATLKGKRVALLDNSKVNAGNVLNGIARRLERLGVGETRTWKKQHAGETGAVLIKDLLAWKPDFSITALGD